MSSDTDVLVRALGEIAMSLRKHYNCDSKANAQKRAVLKWLRSLSGEELASLCCVEDVGFVKTLLLMGSHSRARRGNIKCVQEFQLLPQTGGGSSIVTNKRTANKTPLRSTPRNFVKRPMMQTADGDIVNSFHPKEYEDCCSELLKNLKVLNTLQSCDTVALSMVLFQPMKEKEQQVATQFLHLMEVIARGNFLMECPSDTTLKHRIWGETKWLKEQGYYSLQALIVNQIELNIWAFWRQRQKDKSAKIPLQGLASKLYLVREWEMASINQQNAVKSILSSKAIAHVKNFKQSVPIETAVADRYNSAKSSLKALISVLNESEKRVDLGPSVDVLFTINFEDAIAFPQASIIKLLQAEHFQEQCSLLLCERMSKEEDDSLMDATAKLAPIGYRLLDGRDKAKPMGGNHTQRRRASRKKMLKQRRRDSEIRAAQRSCFHSVLRELICFFRNKKKEAMVCVDKVLHDVIVSAVDGQLTPGGWSTKSNTHEIVLSKLKRKKKKENKKKDDTARVRPGDRKEVLKSLHRAPAAMDFLSLKPHSHQANVKDNADECSAATAGSDSSQCEHDRPRQTDCGSDGESSHGDRPRLGVCFDAGPTGPATASISPAPSLPLPSFEAQNLYSSATTTPYFLSLAPHENQPSRAFHRESDGDNIIHEKSQSNRDGSGSVGFEVQSSSETSNFEWYLPSVFSPPHHAVSSTPSLDWHFDHWQFTTPDGGYSDKSASTMVAKAELDPPPPSFSSSSSSSTSSRFNSARTSGSSKKYSLASFSKIAGLDASRRGNNQSEYEKPRYTVASIREHDKAEMGAADSKNESDFLYQKGGFFDRQRSLKRQRRPWPLNSTRKKDEEDSGEENDVIRRCIGAPTTGKIDTLTERVHSCKCACNRSVCHRDQANNSTEEGGKCSIQNINRDHEHAYTTSSLMAQLHQASNNDIYTKLTMAFERIAELEDKLIERTKIVDEQASNATKEFATLKQAVATLTAQLLNIENKLQELQLQQSSISASCLENSSLGNASSCSSPPAPYSPAPSLEQQAEHLSTAAFPLPETFATANSVMGPFVSVPLSVLPPRSKLHWDMCEFAAQLQADSDARLPAQLAAQRLCTATVQSLWPRAQVRPYGSHVTRLVLPSSDVDLVICLPKVRRDAPADAAGVLEGRNAIKETWQQNLARKLKQEPWVVRDSVKTLPHAAVPIITLLTAPPYNVRLDISFEGPGHNGLATNDVVLALLHEFPPLAPMMLVLKSFAIERGLAVAYSGGLSSYALLLLVARYLQEHSDTMPNGFANASRAVQHSLSTAQAGVADFGLMLMGFLEFYGNRFDPRTTGISVASRCFLNRESSFMAGAVAGSSGVNDPHQVPHQYQQQYAADDAAVDDRTSQYGYYAQHWQVPAHPQMHLLLNADVSSAQGLRRYGYRSSLDLPVSRALDGMGAGLLDYQQLQQQTYDPHKFDPVFIEDPLCPSNNVGRNCFRIMQIRRALSAAHLALLAASRDPTMYADNRVGLVAGVGIHPDNILRAILGPGAPVNAKSDSTSPTGGATAYIGGVEHSFAFQSTNQQQHHHQYAHHHYHYHQPPHQPYYQAGIQQFCSASNENLRRHSGTVTATLTTRSATSTLSHNTRLRKRRIDSPRLVAQNGGHDSQIQGSRLSQKSVEHPQRQSSPERSYGQNMTKYIGRKNSERSMSLSLSFADVVRDGGSSRGADARIPKTSPLAIARPPRFSQDDMALEESINERRETKDDSDLK